MSVTTMRGALAPPLLLLCLWGGIYCSGASAEMSPGDVRTQLDSMLAERRFENDRRIESIQKQIDTVTLMLNQAIAAGGKLQAAEADAIKDQMEIKIEALKEALQTAVESRSRSVNDSFTALKETIHVASVTAKSAVDKADAANEKRFESVNEFRAQQKDFQALLMPRSEAEVKMKASADQITLISQRLDLLSGRSQGADAIWSVLSGVGGLLIGAIGIAIALARSRNNHDHDPAVGRAALEAELSRGRAVISSEIAGVVSRINRLEDRAIPRPAGT